MLRALSFDRPLSPIAYALAAPALLLAQPALVAAAYRLHGASLSASTEFWLIPMRSLTALPDLSAGGAALACAASMALTAALGLISFRRASGGDGKLLAPLTLVPMLQIAAVAMLLFWPRGGMAAGEAAPDEEADDAPKHVLQGVLAGAAIIVMAVLVSAVTFGAYGWGLFVLTPFLTGITTGYIANRRHELPAGRTVGRAITAAVVGSFALIALALEGLVCILMAAPLAAAVIAAGALIGREAALALNARGGPVLCLALLPAFFAFEAATPPEIPIATEESVEIAASPEAVWRALTSSEPIAADPGPVGWAGLAYAERGQILEGRVGGERLGVFSTGTARERITEWHPRRSLAFTVLSHPPAMEEMSPWRRVHAPHVEGYFETDETRFDLDPLPSGGTRLTARASHVLRLDPVLYWEPLARWAIRSNAARVLDDIRRKAEARR